MTALKAILPAIEQIRARLDLYDQVDLDLTIATKLSPDDPDKEKYLARGCRELATYINECELHKVIESYHLPYDRAIAFCDACPDPYPTLMSLCLLSELYPEKHGECLQKVRTVVAEHVEDLYLRSYNAVKIASRFDPELFSDTITYVGDRITVLLEHVRNIASNDPAKALELFKHALSLFVIRQSPELKIAQDGFRWKAEQINRQYQANPSERNLKKLTGEIEPFLNTMQNILITSSFDQQRKLVKEVVLAVVCAAGERSQDIVEAYLDFLDTQFFADQYKNARALMRTIQKRCPDMAERLAWSRKRMTMAQVQICNGSRKAEVMAFLRIAPDSLAKALSYLDIGELAYGDKAAQGLSNYERALFQVKRLKKHPKGSVEECEHAFVEAALETSSLDHQQQDALRDAKINLAAALYPHNQDFALQLLSQLVARTGEECSQTWRLRIFSKKLHKLGPLKDHIAHAIAAIYKLHQEELNDHIFKSAAEYLDTVFPIGAKHFYETSLSKGGDLAVKIALAGLTGNVPPELLGEILQHKDRIHYYLQKLILMI